MKLEPDIFSFFCFIEKYYAIEIYDFGERTGLGNHWTLESAVYLIYLPSTKRIKKVKLI